MPCRLIVIVGIAVLIFGGGINASLRAQASGKQSSQVAMPDWQVAAGKKLAFEVATVKPDSSDKDPQVNFVLGPGDVYAKTGGRLRASNISLLDYVRFAYKLTDGQARILQAAGPSWIATKKFDIEAKSENPDPTKDQMRLMMQSLLAMRFALAVHSEMREMPVLALVLAKPGKLGPELRPHAQGDEECMNVVTGADSSPTISSACGGLVSAGVPIAPSHVRLGGRKIPIALIAAHLGEMAQFDRPIVDETGLRGTFDLVLEWGPDYPLGSTGPSDHDAMQTNVMEALQDQLGLKLKRENAAVKVLVIDHIDERPTEN